MFGDNFGDFMVQVVNKANKLCVANTQFGLAMKYEAPSTALKMIEAVLNKGWNCFISLANLLSIKSYFAFTGALISFLTIPTGILVIGALKFWDGIDSIKMLFVNKRLVEDIKMIGDRYENSFHECVSEQDLEELIENASMELCSIAHA